MSSGPMPTYLAPISQRLPTLGNWRDLQRLLAAYPHQERSWRGHLRVRGTLSGQQTFFEGIALEVSTYEAAPNDDFPLTLLVRLENGQEREVEVKHLQALGVVW